MRAEWGIRSAIGLGDHADIVSADFHVIADFRCDGAGVVARARSFGYSLSGRLANEFRLRDGPAMVRRGNIWGAMNTITTISKLDERVARDQRHAEIAASAARAELVSLRPALAPVDSRFGLKSMPILRGIRMIPATEMCSPQVG